jgi:sodium/pantothenate symporter
VTVAGYLKARYKSDALVVITSLGLIVMCIGTFLFLFFVLRAGGGLAAVMSTADSLLILTVAAIVKDLWETYMVKDDPVKNESYEKHVKLVSTSFS